jgi:hypothetical protein
MHLIYIAPNKDFFLTKGSKKERLNRLMTTMPMLRGEIKNHTANAYVKRQTLDWDI